MCRDAEVLSLFAAIINKLKDRMVSEVPKIFEAVFQVTLQMITKNFEVCMGNTNSLAYAGHAITILYSQTVSGKSSHFLRLCL